MTDKNNTTNNPNNDSDKLGYQPSVRRGFQPQSSDKPETQNPPSGGSSVSKPEPSKNENKK